MFQSYTFGFNEPTMTWVAYVCHLLALLIYSGLLRVRSSGPLALSRNPMVRANDAAGSGASEEGATHANAADPARVSYLSLLGLIALGLLIAAWLSLTAAFSLRWVASGMCPGLNPYQIVLDLTWVINSVGLLMSIVIARRKAVVAWAIIMLIFCLQSYALWIIPADQKQPVRATPGCSGTTSYLRSGIS